MLNKINCVCILFVVLLLPIARGGTIIWPQALAVVVIGICCILTALYFDFGSTKNQLPWLYPWLVITVIIVIQLIPYKPFELTAFEVSNLKNRISAMPGMTIHYWVLFTLYWIITWMVSKLGNNQIILIVCGIGILLCFETIYGIIVHVNDDQKILGMWSVVEHALPSGTFLNRNHYAAVFEVSTPIVLSLLLLPLFHKKFSSPIRVCMGLFFLFIFSLAVFVTYSRLGLICFFIAILIWALLVSDLFAFSKSRKQNILYLLSVFVFILIAGLWFGLEPILARFENIGENNRYFLWKTAIDELPAATWIWGMGAGTLSDNFKLINPIEITKTVHQLHSDWLEFFLDFGLIGSAIIIITFAYWFKKICPSRFTVLHYGAISGIVAIAIHSFGDFPLQIPGVAILFWTMVGIVMNKQLLRRRN